ncbi:MAG: S8 family serine peptidase [Coriobacteriia bacterium]|nr:S8 family serine peptidase [Coriobacteriia bacterium]
MRTHTGKMLALIAAATAVCLALACALGCGKATTQGSAVGTTAAGGSSALSTAIQQAFQSESPAGLLATESVQPTQEATQAAASITSGNAAEGQLLVKYEGASPNLTAVAAAVEAGAADPAALRAAYEAVRAGAAEAADQPLVQALSSLTETEQALAVLGITSAESLDASDSMAVLALPAGVSAEEAYTLLAATPGVSYVQPDYLYSLMEGETPATADTAVASAADPLAVTPNDTLYSYQYALTNTNLTQAWEDYPATATSTVAVIDTGCRTDHEDLQANLLLNLSYDFDADTPLTQSASNGDAQGHGTHVTGIVAATSNNALGVAGSTKNNTTKVVALNVFNTTTGKANSSVIIKALNYVSTLVSEGTVENLHVVNMSLGWYPDATDFPVEDMGILEPIQTLRNQGVLCVCAGGNGNGSTAYTRVMMPADYDECLSVTALKSDGTNVVYSDYNQYKDISAPGYSIYSTYKNSASSYAYMNGTSMASPVVAGAAAYLWSLNPQLSVDEVVNALKSTATEVVDTVNDRRQTSGSAGALNTLAAAAAVSGPGLTPVTAPAARTNLTYTGLPQTGVLEGEGYTLQGAAVATNAGTYQVTAVPSEGYCWNGGSTDSLTISWTIATAPLSAAYVSETVDCTGSPALTVLVSGFVNGETAATAAGYQAPTVQAPASLTNVESLTITPFGGQATNYHFTYTSGTLTVAHTQVTDAAVPATCTEGGLTQGSHCGVCGKVLVAQQVLPTTGHTWPTTTVKENEVAATCTEDGGYDAVAYCTTCGAELSRARGIYPALGHKFPWVSTWVKSPTCTEPGEAGFECERGCGYTEITVLAALGHNWGEGVVTKQPTHATEGVRTYTCLQCGETYTESIPTTLFPDVQPNADGTEPWYFDSVYASVKLGLFGGYKGGDRDGFFGPDDGLTRGQAAVVLWRWFNLDEATAYVPASAVNETRMSDVESGQWYTGAANWAVANKVINGKDQADGTRLFDPNAPLTREQLCAVVANAAATLKGADTSSDGTKLAAMPDEAAVSSWARESVAWALDQGIISGKLVDGQRLVAPGATVTRAEMAAILVNAINKGVL